MRNFTSDEGVGVEGMEHYENGFGLLVVCGWPGVHHQRRIRLIVPIGIDRVKWDLFVELDVKLAQSLDAGELLRTLEKWN